MITEDTRYHLLAEYTKDEVIIAELLAYTKNKFTTPLITDFDVDATHDPSLEHWETSIDMCSRQGAFSTLRSNWVQFHFPIKKNISTDDAYRKVTLRGIAPEDVPGATGLMLRNPQGLELQTYEGIAGKIPVLLVPDEEDFCDIIRALCHKNEKVHIPKTMGAAMIKGINNWQRIYKLKEQWENSNVFGDWNSYFKKHILPNPELYKDKMIVLSTKPYSNISAKELHLTDKEWITHSVQIRLAHECSHLFTLKQYGKMANNMHDEIIADYAGICSVLGRFHKDWFLKFIGLEKYPEYRKGSRFENYLGTPPLSAAAFDILKIIIKQAIDNVYEFDNQIEGSLSRESVANRLTALCSLDLITMASTKGAELLRAEYQKSVLAPIN